MPLLSDLEGPLLSRLKPIVSHTPVILLASRRISSGLATFGAWTSRLDVLDPVEVRRRFPRLFTARLIDALLMDLVARLAVHPLLAAHGLLLERLIDALSANPPVRTVKAMARKGHRGARWLEAQWAAIWKAAPAGIEHPQLTNLMKVILFLRALSTWLFGRSLKESAAAIGVSPNTLAAYFVQFTGDKAGELELDSLPKVVLQITQDAFGWVDDGQAGQISG